MAKTTGFFAYSSNPASCGEAIEEAIQRINKSGDTHITSWITLKNNGKLIISEIIKAIDESDYVCADITGLNDNVLFEIGYSIGIKKPLWLIFDTSYIESERRFKELGILSTIAYTPYSNTINIVDEFYKQNIFEAKRPDEIIGFNNYTIDDRRALLFLKSQIPTNSSQVIVDEAKKLKLPIILDDAVENKVQPISWYVEQFYRVPAVLAQFSSTARNGFELQNSKASLVSGIAIGLKLKLLMIAETPYDTPMDYRELMKKYVDKNSCKVIITPYLEELQRNIGELLTKKNINAQNNRQRSILQKINFGEFVAEHESESLFDYYVETNHYQNLIKTEYNIIVGRKGSGKTATLYYLRDTFQEDPRNHVCLIKPVNFEIDGLISLIRKSSDFEAGNLVESVWKFLIFTEIAKMFYDKIKSKQPYAISPQENNFLAFAEKHKGIILEDFSTRLDEQLTLLVNVLSGIENLSQSDFKLKLSELLHDGILHDLKNHFAVIVNANHKIIVLIDNLDKSWRKSSDLPILSKCILGLLGVTGRIVKDLQVIKSKNTKLSFHLTLFLRSDIFSHIIQYSREPDKIEVSRLRYNDSEIFFRIIEERFVVLNEKEVIPSDLWENFIVKEIDGMPIKDFIFSRVLPRPRDIIFLLRSAKDIAVSRGHEKITEEDVISAYSEYSSWLFTSLLAENGVTIKQLEDFLYQLAGSSMIIEKNKIKEMMKMANIQTETDKDVDKFVNHLVSLSILGREVHKDEFRFEYDFDVSAKIEALAKKMESPRFRIHNALIPHLECVI